MKVLLIISALCVASALGGLTDAQKAKLKAYKDACIAETGVDPVLVENAKKGEIAGDDEKLQCFAACLLKRIGILNADGQVQEDVARAKVPADVPQEQVELIINRCKGLTGKNQCQTGGLIFKCFLETKSFNIL